jgi:hypothetical protein
MDKRLILLITSCVFLQTELRVKNGRVKPRSLHTHHIRMFLVCLSNLIPDLSKKFSAHSPTFRATVLYIKNIYFAGYVEPFTWHMLERLLEYGTYRTPRVVSE